MIYQLLALYHLVRSNPLEFLLACNQLEHTVHDVVARELVKGRLAVPSFHMIHSKAAPPVVVLLQHIAHQIEPVGAPSQLI